jgi:hypothetical protein
MNIFAIDNIKTKKPLGNFPFKKYIFGKFAILMINF